MNLATTAPSPGASLRLTGLVKRYSGTAVVDAIELDVKAGEFITFLGPSGSGKTTTLNMIAGFVNPDEGEILVDGRDISHTPPHRRDIGVVFQSYALFPHMTVRENIAYPLQQRRPRIAAAEITRLVDEAMKMVELGSYGDRRPAQLSGGQQQRVALARALVFSPKLLLLDEPLGALDKRLREALQLELRRLHRELGITIIFVTHDQEEALALSDRIVVFNDGRVEQVGTPEQVYERPETPFVARFLGDSNIFEGAIVDGLLSGADQLRVADATNSANAVVLVRPENLMLQTEPAANGALNSLPIEIVDVTFVGSSRRIDAVTRAGRSLIIRDHAFSVSAEVGELRHVVFSPNHCRVVQESPVVRQRVAAQESGVSA